MSIKVASIAKSNPIEELKEQIILALKDDFLANIERHRLNIEIMLRSPTALGDFGSLLAAVEFMETHGNEEGEEGERK